jgi:DNA mismatch repair protein MutS2
LDEARFPNLTILKKKEIVLVEKIARIMERLFANKKYVAQLSGFTRNKPEPYEFEGRTIVAASREVGQKIGVIRGHAKNGSFCYVEPNEIVLLGNELLSIRAETNSVVNEIADHLSGSIVRAAGSINRGLDSVARLDVIFARAAFGFTLNGSIPRVEDEGSIQVEGFIHPVLAINGGSRTVSVDLQISNENDQRTLIISGPNGGGKSLAMKSFGLVAIMAKIGIPIPRDDYSKKKIDETRVDFFDEVLVEVGDHQSLMEGESTYMAQLNSLSKLLERIKPVNGAEGKDQTSSLILLDELGGGTDPTAGSSIAQAILEKILENSRARTIITTHSTQLKALSIDDNRFESASVLLQVGNSDGSQFRLPTYKLCYGAVGNSYALGAASRSNPPIPDDVLDRAAELIASSQDRSGEYLRTITEALEAEKEMLEDATEATEAYKQDIIRCRDAMVFLAKSYEQHLSRIENRLDNMLVEMKKGGDKDAYELAGDSLSMLRLVKKVIKSKADVMREKGMRIVSMSDIMRTGEQVVVVSKGEFDGETGEVSDNQNDAGFDELSVDLEFEFGLTLSGNKITVNMKRSDLAIWDYPTLQDDWGSSFSESTQPRTIPDSRNKLQDVLSSLKTSTEERKKNEPVNAKSNGTFVSSRQRKAASKKAKKKKK